MSRGVEGHARVRVDFQASSLANNHHRHKERDLACLPELWLSTVMTLDKLDRLDRLDKLYRVDRLDRLCPVESASNRKD